MRKNSVFNQENSYLNSWYNITKGFGEFFKERSADLEITPAEAMLLSKIYYKDGISQREIAHSLIVSEANIISNPNIRFLILCGAEVQGHITGQSIQALHENGCDPEKKKITGATGAIPFVENIPMEGVERFQQQVELVDLIDNEDGGAITAKVKECIEKDPGALEEDALVIDLDEEKAKKITIEAPSKNEELEIDA